MKFDEIKDRRQKVLSLMVKNLSEREIAQALNVSQPTICRDVWHLKKEAQQYIDKVAKALFGEIYKLSIDGIDEVIKESWLMYHNANADKIKLQALSTAMQAYQTKISILGEGPAVMGVKKLVDKYEELEKLVKGSGAGSIAN